MPAINIAACPTFFTVFGFESTTKWKWSRIDFTRAAWAVLPTFLQLARLMEIVSHAMIPQTVENFLLLESGFNTNPVNGLRAVTKHLNSGLRDFVLPEPWQTFLLFPVEARYIAKTDI